MASQDDSGLTLLGPLTTIFTPPATCHDLTVLSISTVYSTVVTVTKTISDGSAVSVYTVPTITTSTTAYLEKYDYVLDDSCYPEGYTTYSAYYSPGRCPAAWEGVVTTAQNGETTIQCCPTSFTFSGELCRSSVTESTTTSVVLYKNELRVDPTPTPSYIPDEMVWATGIIVRYRDGDFPTTTASKSSSATNSIAAPTSTFTPSDPSSSESNSGLPLGGKIGLGLGIPVAVIILAILAFLLFRRRRAATTPTVAGPPQAPPQQQQAYAQPPPQQYSQPPPPQQYYQPMEQSVPAGYWEAKPEEMARASEIYTPSAAGSPRFGGAQSTGYAPVAQVGAYAPAHETGYAPVAQVGAYAPSHDTGYAPVVGSGQEGYGQEARAPSAPSGYAPAAAPEYAQQASAPIVPSQRLPVPPVEGASRQWSGGGGPLPDPAELYPEYAAGGDDDDSVHGGRR
ncbi:hypothetical protein VE01_04524 [Pseudogymnoascus verrucosus]|uniref:Uncharacterized protein n=1 Tax=Pseudogymnoascus verrucosus TaxID=342668 RepID=A0A1B8GNV8_9PEZI|nr:uncharacterized protein VE01_04524 [Pseudogymnoascus verrucosus]OBT97507.1 hypothetical protein VE01_04524 [Pseudogymnoascus verrucosus]